MQYRARIPELARCLIWQILIIPPLSTYENLAFAQADFGGAAKFEVASIRQNTAGPQAETIRFFEAGSFIMTNVPVIALIADAFNVRGPQILGGPGWLTSNRYDINAKANAPSGRGEMMAMLRGLLEERFGLKIHKEVRESPGFVLQASNRGAKLRSSAEGGPVEPFRFTPFGIAGRSISLGELVAQLSRYMGFSIVDESGISGKFDIDVRMSPDLKVAFMTPGYIEELQRAIEVQLGLSFRERTLPVESIVIDAVHLPDPN